MKLFKTYVNSIFNFIIKNTMFLDKDITQSKDFDTDVFNPQPVLICNIIKECSDISSEDIKATLCLLNQSNIIEFCKNENGRVTSVSITKFGYSKLLEKFFDFL